MSAITSWRPSRQLMDIGLGLCALTAGAWILFSGLAFHSSPGWGYDFEAYLLAADRLARGASPYLNFTLAGPFRPGPYGLYLYAPPLAVILLPLTAISLPAATAAFFTIRAVLLISAVLLMPLRWRTRLVVLVVAGLSESVQVDLKLGNVSIIVLFLAVVAWRFLDRPPGAAATALAITIRPTFAIFLAWWVVRRRWQPFAICILIGLLVILATLPAVGIDGYRDFVTLLHNLSDATGVPNNVDIGSVLERLGLPQSPATIGLFGGYLLAIGAVVVSLRRDVETSFLVTLGATLLLSPLLWDHYLVLALPAIGFLLERRRGLGVLLAVVTLFWMSAGWAPIVALAATLGPFLAPRPKEASIDLGEATGVNARTAAVERATMIEPMRATESRAL